jgi:hypothetical protein
MYRNWGSEGEKKMIENLSIDKIKEMIWEEVFVKHVDEIGSPGNYAWFFVEYLAEFTRYHRLCKKDCEEAYARLQREGRKLPNGFKLVYTPEAQKGFAALGDEYEGMTHSGALQCVKLGV